MSLYRMELYKLLHKKICTFGFLACMLWLLFVFYAEYLSSEVSVVNGVRYEGISAVKKDREITEEFKGSLTDSKIDRIVETYGFPKLVIEGGRGWQDQNYLNAFVTEYLSDCYLYGWEEGEYREAQHPISIENSEMGQLMAKVGMTEEIYFDYFKGWEALMGTLQFGFLFLCSWIVIMAAPVFAGERQQKMKEIAFTAEHGRKQDVLAKLGAVFTLSLFAGIIMVLTIVLITGSTYGFSGGEGMSWLALAEPLAYGYRISQLLLPVWQVVLLYIAVGIGAMLVTTAITVLVSACSKSSFYVAAVTLIVWTLPYLLALLRGICYWLIASTQPILLIMDEAFYEIIGMKIFGFSIFFYHVFVMTAELLLLTVVGYRRYLKGERE